ncbi:uncharacterized protein LOC132182392 isoform X2 [Corylus avellana]|uniref:uncharacterized protein LOC132182392 isoform X2 n=1 Tax=Corylus avellana TaxID=13451 RepID=UPI00286A288F|nr:uncharacterized protein LOC132182392 isoform X2 [Corylus avellana]
MFDILFGWRKATKCKKLINQVRCRLKLLKNKRNSIVRQLREDLSQLIKIGHDHIAFNRVEQLTKDESIVAVYELLDHFCEFILIHLSYIRRHKDCPNDINEAVSTLIYASARCGELPELLVIRKLFGERYGQRFAMTAVELFPGNLVNREIKEKLSMNSVPEDVKNRLVDEIARQCCLEPGVLALDYYPGWQNQQVKEDVQTCCNTSKGSEMQASSVEEVERNVMYVDSISTNKNILIELCNSLGHQDSDITSTFSGSSIVQQSSLNAEEPSPMHVKTQKVEKAKLNSPYKYTVSGLEHKKVRKITASSSESLPQFSEETIVYLDDIEEFQSFKENDGDCQDQRLFKFKSSVLPKSEKIGIIYDQGNMEDHCESWSEKSGSRSSRKSGNNASGKRFRRMSMSRENESLNDVECSIYYEKPSKSSPTHQPRKHQKKTPGVGRQHSYHAQKRLKKPCLLDLGTNFQSCHCSVRHPFYFCTSDDKHSQQVLPWKQKTGITTLVSFPTPGNGVGESDKEMEWTDIPQKPRRSYDNGATVYNVFTYPNWQPDEQKKKEGEGKGKAEKSDSPGSCVCSKVSCQRVTSSFTRAETMPPERAKENVKEAMSRSNSCPFQYPKHVHPKLPDYDDIAAKFMALKQELLQNKGCGSSNNSSS